jgi:hypothetical protein
MNGHVCDFSQPYPHGHPVPPEDPERVKGPAMGAVVRYHDGHYPKWDRLLMRVKARSYVWSPGECSANGGHRHYDWTVVEWPALSWDGRVVWQSMVVDDVKLEEVGNRPTPFEAWDD